MSETLAEKTCTPCRGGIPPLTRDEALRLQEQAPDWELRYDARRIERTFRFRNFREALGFVQRVGELAESEGHHPDISFGWGLRNNFPKHQEDQGTARERVASENSIRLTRGQQRIRT
jgi:pterin-4a-carbinolamine dehydratase